ncbi:flippase [Halorussus marinus]|uniref:flippase n=1 Tax=Halorussus marinus TaxID=2505976 RepID=UPI00106EB961|nr:flippase [Halorussus marinus]
MSEEDDILQLVKGSGVLLLGYVANYGIGFLTQVVMARQLGTTGYGIVTLGMVFTSSVTIFSLFGLHKGFGRFIPRFDEDSRRGAVVLLGLAVSLPITLTFAAISFIFSSDIALLLFRDPDMARPIRIFALGIVPFTVLRLSVGISQGLQRSWFKAVVRNILLPGSRFVFVIVVLTAGLGYLGIAWAYVGSLLFAGFAGVVFILRNISFGDDAWDAASFELARRLLVFSIPLVITATMTTTLQNLDSFLIGYFSIPDDVGIYRAAYMIAQMLTVFLGTLGFLFMPMMSELHSDERGDRMEALYQTVTKWIVVLSVPFVLVLVTIPEIVLTVVYGQAYTESAIVLVVLAFGFLLHAITGLNDNTLISVGNSRVVMVDNVVAVLLNIVLNVVLIPRYSFVGAAVATAITFAVRNVLYTYHLYRYVGILPQYSGVKRHGATIVLFLVIALVIRWFLPTARPLLLVGQLALLLLLYSLSILKIGLVEEREREILTTIVEENPKLFALKRLFERFAP